MIEKKGDKKIRVTIVGIIDLDTYNLDQACEIVRSLNVEGVGEIMDIRMVSTTSENEPLTSQHLSDWILNQKFKAINKHIDKII